MIGKVLLTRATEHIDWVVMKAIVFFPTKPAPGVPALPASHMITAGYLFKSYLTSRTITNISIVGSPAEEILV